MKENIENKIQEQDQEMAGLNNLNDDYKEYPPKKEEYPKLNFVDITKYGRVIDKWWEGC